MINSEAVKLAQAMGKDDSHIDFSSLEAPIASECVEDIVLLKHEALKQGFELTIASGYRSYARQLEIWNAKVRGDRPIRDKAGELTSLVGLSDIEKVETIMFWSALPGASRHHWGSDFDVYDKRVIPASYKLQLTTDECSGLFKEFYDWLASFLADCESTFFRPYFPSCNSISPEPWHISHRKCSEYYEMSIELSNLKAHIQSSDILLKEIVLDRINELFNKYISVSSFESGKEFD